MKLHDLDQTEAWSSTTRLSPGRHLCVIDSVEETEKNGKPQLVLELRSIGGPEVGGTLRDYQVVNAKTYGRVKQIIVAAGIEVQGGEWDFQPPTLQGREVAIQVILGRPREQGEHAGKRFAEVGAYDTPKASDRTGSDLATDADTSGFASNGSSAVDDSEIPFRVRPPHDRDARRRDVFTGDRWIA